MTAAARMIQTSEACVDPNVQLSLTLPVFAEMSTMSKAISATKRKAPA